MNWPSLNLITLNAWGGRAIEPFITFLSEKARSTDIFCFQEMFDAPQDTLDARHKDEGLRGDLFLRACQALPEFHGMFAYHDDDPTRMSLAMFIRRSVDVIVSADRVVYRPKKPKEHGRAVFSTRKLQYATILLNGRRLTISNYHGLWTGGHKRDSPERLEQSRSVCALVNTLQQPSILCGDFNLEPDTESLRMLADGRCDLVSESNVKSTRTALYRHHDDPAHSKFADYILSSSGIDIHHFEVLSDKASDHAPLLLQFS